MVQSRVTGIVVIVTAFAACGFTMLRAEGPKWEYARYMVFYEKGGVVWQTPTSQVVAPNGYTVLTRLGVPVQVNIRRDQYDFIKYAGSQSWELFDCEVDIEADPSYVVYLFKRPK